MGPHLSVFESLQTIFAHSTNSYAQLLSFLVDGTDRYFVSDLVSMVHAEIKGDVILLSGMQVWQIVDDFEVYRHK